MTRWPSTLSADKSPIACADNTGREEQPVDAAFPNLCRSVQAR